MKKQVIIYIILAVAILLFVQGAKKDKVSVADTNVKAAEMEIDVWDGTADTSWYEEVRDRHKVWTISTPEQLAGVAKLVNEEGVTFEGQTIQLTNDIYLNEDWENYKNWGSDPPENEWEPIGGTYKAAFFGGDFSGESTDQGYTIYGMYIDSEEDQQGLFGGVAYSYGNISYVNIRDSYVSGSDCVGSLVGEMSANGTISHCSSNAVVWGKMDESENIGGIAGICGSGIKYTCNMGNVSGQYNVGGIVGLKNGVGNIEGCCNKGTVTGNEYIGGLVGTTFGDVSGSCNQGTVSGNSRIGGVAGLAIGDSSFFWCNYVVGKIIGKNKMGLLIGQEEKYNKSDIVACYVLKTEDINNGLYDVGCDIDGNPYNHNFADTKEVTKEQFATGEVAYEINWVFGQELGKDEYPVVMDPAGETSSKTVCKVNYVTNSKIVKTVYINAFNKLEMYEPEEISGYTFGGWYTSNLYPDSAKWDFDEDVVSCDVKSGASMTLWARYIDLSATPIPSITPSQTPVSTPAPTTMPSSTVSKKQTKTVRKKKKLKAPIFFLKKKKTKSGKRYVQIKLKKYKGKYVEIKASIKNGKKKTIFYSIKLKNSNIKKNKKVFNIKYKKQKGTFIFKLRTYKKKGKKKVYSYYSKEKRIRLT